MSRKKRQDRESIINYEAVDGQDAQARLDRAFDILFDEVLRRRAARLVAPNSKRSELGMDDLAGVDVKLSCELSDSLVKGPWRKSTKEQD